MQGSSRNNSGLRAHTGVVDQGSAVKVQGTTTLAVAAMGGSGLGSLRRTAKLRARVSEHGAEHWRSSGDGDGS